MSQIVNEPQNPGLHKKLSKTRTSCTGSVELRSLTEPCHPELHAYNSSASGENLSGWQYCSIECNLVPSCIHTIHLPAEKTYPAGNTVRLNATWYQEDRALECSSFVPGDSSPGEDGFITPLLDQERLLPSRPNCPLHHVASPKAFPDSNACKAPGNG